MDPSALAALVAQLLQVGIQIYSQIEAANSSVPPLATVLAQADADWDAVAAQAKAQLNPPQPTI
jgi:hypothetical protein